MKTVETENEGLKRAYKLIIPAKDIDARVDGEVKRIAPTVRMPGFRPGKVPPNLIRKMHGEALMRDALNTAVQDSVQQLLDDKKLRPAMQPEVELDEDYETGKDAEINIRLETLPDVPTPKIEGLKLERLTVEADEKAVEDQLKHLAQSQTRYEDAKKGHKAANGDQVVIDFVGKVDDIAFEGGTGEGMAVVLGSGQLHAERACGAREGPTLSLAGRVVGRDQDERPLQPELVGEAGKAGSLDGVVRDHADVVAVARGVVEVGLVRLAERGARLRQADERVARRDHWDPAAGGPVQDRDLDRGAARVVGADHADHVWVGGVLLCVRATEVLVPLAR
jgi:hypothetical protein